MRWELGWAYLTGAESLHPVHLVPWRGVASEVTAGEHCREALSSTVDLLTLRHSFPLPAFRASSKRYDQYDL